MISRTFDPDTVNELLNDPAIRPTIGGDGELDATELLQDRRNVCLLSDGGGAMFHWRGPGVFEGHSFFRVRGREAVTLGKQMLSVMSEDANLIWGNTPEALRHVRMFNRLIGFRSLGMIDTPDLGRCELFEKRF